MLDAEKFKKRIQKEIDREIEWLETTEPKDVVRIFDNLMSYGVAKILLGRELLTNFDKYEPTIREMVKDYKKFSYELRDNYISFCTTGVGYGIGHMNLIETKPYFMQVDEDFSIKKFREYVKKIVTPSLTTHSK